MPHNARLTSVLLETKSLTKRYGRLAALRDCSFSTDRGEILGLLGPNGAGKTTLLRLLMGYQRPSAGSASIDGKDCYRESVAVHRQLTYLPGETRLFRRLTGKQTLELFASLRPEVSLTKSFELADRLQLDLSRQVRRMSTGMRQKLALAAVLTPEVPLVILDEPTSNLDPNIRREVLDLISETRVAGRTVLFSSHVLSEVEEVCDRAVLLRDGELVETITMADLRKQHRIQLKLTGPLGAPGEQLAKTIEIDIRDRQATILTEGNLAPLLGWLAEQPIDELAVEPVGLQTIYERFHPSSSP